jgi:magnesium-transporting ATPase (P-type)
VNASESGEIDELTSLAEIFRGLRTNPGGLTSRDAARRLIIYGPNELTRRGGRQWPRELLRQFTQPLAVLLMIAAVLSWLGGTAPLSIAIVVVILLNAGFSFFQQLQAEKAVEALAAFLPARAHVLRDASPVEVAARDLVPGDVLIVAEGDQVCADARIISGDVVMDLSALSGESRPVSRRGEAGALAESLLEARELLFSGTTCLGGDAVTVVTRTGMHTELGRIAALSQRVHTEPSPLERQVARATWIIAAIAVAVGVVFLPLGLWAGLSWTAVISFSIGLIVANVPEGLLPTITLALAAGVRDLARHGAVVKRLSAVETLGSTTVICTDKTGTLTENRMRVTRLWLGGPSPSPGSGTGTGTGSSAGGDSDVAAVDANSPQAQALAYAAAICTSAQEPSPAHPAGSGDPTELALLALGVALGVGVTSAGRDSGRRKLFHFDAGLARMTSIDEGPVGSVVIHTKGALETVLPCCRLLLTGEGNERELTDADRAGLAAQMDEYARHGLRVLAVARRALAPDTPVPTDRLAAETELTLLGLVAMVDPARPDVRDAVTRAHQAGIRIHVITGDYGLTAAEIARQVGIGHRGSRVVTGEELGTLSDSELEILLATDEEIIFARTSPEAKLRVCEALRETGNVVAMTGDGVNDAPALRFADIGVAMGRSGTDVAREASTMVLTDDNFATIVTAVDAGRRVFDNVRKFVLYIFAHAIPEVLPFLVFALSGGAVPLPLTVMQILAIDLGTETLPALALGREPAEPGLMQRPPRPRSVGVIDRRMLARAWGLLGVTSAALVLLGFFVVLWQAGWQPGAPTGEGTPLHEAYRQATTVSFVGIVSCQIGTAFAARTDHASLFSVGVFSNRLLLWGIGFEIVFTAAVVYVPLLQHVFGTAALSLSQWAMVAPFPLIVWGVDETVRWIRRRRRSLTQASTRQNGVDDAGAGAATPTGALP